MYLKKELSEAWLPVFRSKWSQTINFSRLLFWIAGLLRNGFYPINFGQRDLYAHVPFYMTMSWIWNDMDLRLEGERKLLFKQNGRWYLSMYFLPSASLWSMWCVNRDDPVLHVKRWQPVPRMGWRAGLWGWGPGFHPWCWCWPFAQRREGRRSPFLILWDHVSPWLWKLIFSRVSPLIWHGLYVEPNEMEVNTSLVLQPGPLGTKKAVNLHKQDSMSVHLIYNFINLTPGWCINYIVVSLGCYSPWGRKESDMT